MHKPFLLLLAASALAGCGSAAPEAPGAESIGEKRALGDAAEMLNQQRTPAASATAIPAK